MALKPISRPAGERWRAPCAADPGASRGRLISEPASTSRSEFQRDRDRIIHSTAFRRLKHKTQVFLEHEGDHYRTRLTHSLEVAQIARSIARALGLDEDLAETLALAHDLGHTPFGHAGERALERCLAGEGGFDHNAQSLKIVTSLERRYAAFDGLNLTWETLEGLVKHNGPLTDRAGHPAGSHAGKPFPETIVLYDRAHPLDLWSHASAEAQAAALADDIAYNAHDIDDGLRSGILKLDELDEVPFLAELLTEIRQAWPGLERARFTHELQRRIITRLVEDVISESTGAIEAGKITSPEAVRLFPMALVRFSGAMEAHVKALRAFLFPRLYRHRRIMDAMDEAERIVEQLYSAFVANPGLLPEEWRDDIASSGDHEKAVRVADFIAGMTDRYAIDMHCRMFDAGGKLR